MNTKEQIKDQIIELNFDLLKFFEDENKVRQVRDKIQLLLIEYLS